MANISDQNTSLRLFTSLKIRINDILGETISFLQDRFKQAKTIFTAASPFGQLLIVFENLSQLIFYYIEDSITELNIYEASRPSSIYSLAAIAGHNPSRAIGATAQVRLVRKLGIPAPANKVILNDLFRLRCEVNGLTYVIELPQDEIRLNLTGPDTPAIFSIKQGIIESQTFTGKGIAMESYQLGYPNNYYIDNFRVNVYVNGEPWTRFDSMLDIPRNAKGYVLKTGITNGLDLYFGNGSFGKIPQAGAQITVEYLVSEGAGGNIKVDDPSQVLFTFAETAFSPIGDEINLNDYFDIYTVSPPSFGVDPEEIALTRLIAPKASKNFALVNVDNYEVLLHKMQMFSTVRVFLDEPYSEISDSTKKEIIEFRKKYGVAPIVPDTRIISLFLVPDVSQMFKSGADYFNLPTSKFSLTAFQKTELLKYIERSGTKMISSEVNILDPVIIRYVINVSVIAFDDIAGDVIKSDISDKIGNYFIKLNRNNRVPKSDLIKIIEEINGVDSVSVTILSELNELAFSNNPARDETQLIGLDEFNDIIMTPTQFPVIRGGWTDRNGNTYQTAISDSALGAINIEIKSVRSIRKRLTLL
jgi:hypothetical protein